MRTPRRHSLIRLAAAATLLAVLCAGAFLQLRANRPAHWGPWMKAGQVEWTPPQELPIPLPPTFRMQRVGEERMGGRIVARSVGYGFPSGDYDLVVELLRGVAQELEMELQVEDGSLGGAATMAGPGRGGYISIRAHERSGTLSAHWHE